MKGSRLSGAALGAALALTAGGIAVGFSSHPVGINSIGFDAGGGRQTFTYAHVDGDSRGADLDVFLFEFTGQVVRDRTRVGPNGYASQGGPAEYDYLYAHIRICDDGCRTWSGRLKQARRDESIDDSSRTFAGRLDGESVIIELVADGQQRVAESGQHYLEPGYPYIYVGEGVASGRPMIVSSVTVGNQLYPANEIGHNHGELYRYTGAGLQVRSFMRSRAT